MAHGWLAFVDPRRVVLTVTGAEALYADMGHFGREPIRLAWLCFVLPALLLNYFGQGALVLRDPSALENPFYLLAPEVVRLPLVLLATVATVIASQAVLSGAFSLARQCMQMSFLPRLTVRHTSLHRGGPDLSAAGQCRLAHRRAAAGVRFPQQRRARGRLRHRRHQHLHVHQPARHGGVPPPVRLVAPVGRRPSSASS